MRLIGILILAALMATFSPSPRFDAGIQSFRLTYSEAEAGRKRTIAGLAAAACAKSKQCSSSISNTIRQGASRAGAALQGRIQPEIGRKLDYLFGRATGDAHNLTRTREMYERLRRVGINDTRSMRTYVANHLRDVLNDPSSIREVQENGRILRESFLMGPGGGLRLHSVWEGSRVITFFIR